MQIKLLVEKNVKTTCGLIVIAAVNTFLIASAPAESPNVIGNWTVDIAFGDGRKHSLRFDAQSDGKGTLTVTDPQYKVWGGAKPSEAKWAPDKGNSVTFSGPVEFMLGNVGRDSGTLTFKGKFETPDSITGEVDFSPLVGEGLSKHGTFKAVRSTQ